MQPQQKSETGSGRRKFACSANAIICKRNKFWARLRSWAGAAAGGSIFYIRFEGAYGRRTYEEMTRAAARKGADRGNILRFIARSAARKRKEIVVAQNIILSPPALTFTVAVFEIYEIN
jgi:hypothetical protein